MQAQALRTVGEQLHTKFVRVACRPGVKFGQSRRLQIDPRKNPPHRSSGACILATVHAQTLALALLE